MLDAPKHNTAAELTWTFIPTLIVIVIFFYGFKGYLHMVVPPPDAYEVDVTAHMWALHVLTIPTAFRTISRAITRILCTFRSIRRWYSC